MKGTISRVSPFGFQTNETGSDKWLNLSKYDKSGSVDVKGLNKGDEVEYEVNGKGYLTKLSKLGSAPAEAAQQGQPSDKRQSAPASSDGGRGARQTAVNAAFGEPLRLLASSEGTSVEEALDKTEVLAKRLVQFITSGEFDAPAQPEAKQ